MMRPLKKLTTKQGLAVALFGTAVVGVISCGGGGSGSTSSLTNETVTNQTENVTKAVVEGNLPAGLTVDNRTADIQNKASDNQTVTDVWAVLDNGTPVNGYFEEVNGTYKFVIPEVPTGTAFTITFVNGEPNNITNETVVALTPPVMVTNGTAVINTTEVVDGIVQIDSQNSLGIVVNDNQTIIDNLKQAVGQPMVNATKIIVNATQVAQQQMQNGTQVVTNSTQNATTISLTKGWYKNYSVGLYQENKLENLGLSNQPIYFNNDAGKNLITNDGAIETVVNGYVFVLGNQTADGIFDVFYQLDPNSGAVKDLTTIANLGTGAGQIQIPSTHTILHGVYGQYIVLYHYDPTKLTWDKAFIIDTKATQNAVTVLTDPQDTGKIIWGSDKNKVYIFDKQAAKLTNIDYNDLYKISIDKLIAIDDNDAWVFGQDSNPYYYISKVIKTDTGFQSLKPVQPVDETGKNAFDTFDENSYMAFKDTIWVLADQTNKNYICAVKDINGTLESLAGAKIVDTANTLLKGTGIFATNATNVVWLKAQDGTPNDYIARAYIDNNTVKLNAGVQGLDQGGTAVSTIKLIVPIDTNNAWMISNDGTDDYVNKVNLLATGNIEVSKGVIIQKDDGTTLLLQDIVDVNSQNAWVIADTTGKYVAKVTYSANEGLNATKAVELNDGVQQSYLANNDTLIVQIGPTTLGIVGITYDSNTNQVEASYADAGQTIQAITPIDNSTFVLYDGGKAFKVYQWNRDNAAWDVKATLSFSKEIFDPTVDINAVKNINSTALNGTFFVVNATTSVGTKLYLLKYNGNDTLEISPRGIKTDAIEFLNDNLNGTAVNTDNGYVTIYYLVPDISQWGNLKVELNTPQIQDKDVAAAYVYNNTLYTIVSDATNQKTHLLLVGAQNKLDATVEKAILDPNAANTINNIIPVGDDGTYAAIDDNGYLIVGSIYNDTIEKSVKFSLGDITSDGTYIYGIDSSGNVYKINKQDLSNLGSKQITTDTISALRFIRYINGVLAVFGDTTNGYLAVRVVDPNTMEPLTDWIPVIKEGTTIKVTTNGNYIYINNDWNLNIIDFSNAKQPKIITQTYGDYKDFTVLNQEAYAIEHKIIDGLDKYYLAKLDLTNATAPKVVSEIGVGTLGQISVLPDVINKADTDDISGSVSLYAYGDYFFLTEQPSRRVKRWEVYQWNSTELKYMGDAEVPYTLTKYYIKLINGKYYLVSADGKYIHVLNLNPKEVK